jgi:hypothetical protein
MVLGYISRETLCEKINLEALVHVEAKPHVDKPPGTPQVADGLAEQEFLSYLVEKMVGSTKQVTTKGNRPPLASLSAADR